MSGFSHRQIFSLVRKSDLPRFLNRSVEKKNQLCKHSEYGPLLRQIEEFEISLKEEDEKNTNLVKFSKRKVFFNDVQTNSENLFYSNLSLVNELENLVQNLRPWRKGPYQLLHRWIDSEWNSGLKWYRWVPHLPDLKGKTVCDLGGNNGYFSFRLLDLSVTPDFILILDPTFRYYLQYRFLRLFGWEETSHQFEMMGFEELNFFPKAFDLVLALGILYHHPNPLAILKLIHQSLRKEGEIWIDCQGVKEAQDVKNVPPNFYNLPWVLFPSSTYTGKKGFWFLPTMTALKSWLNRSGFSQIEVVFEEKLSLKEQKMTFDSPYLSLEDGLMRDGGNDVKTVEGYPSPVRFYLKAKKS